MSDEWKINNIQFYFQEQGTKTDYDTINAQEKIIQHKKKTFPQNKLDDKLRLIESFNKQLKRL